MDTDQLGDNFAENILDKGVRVNILAPRLFRFMGKKTFLLVLYAPSGGTLMRMYYWFNKCNTSIEYLEIVSATDPAKFDHNYAPHVYKSLASLFLRDKLLTDILLYPFARLLQKKIDRKEAVILLKLAILGGGTGFMLDTIRYVRNSKITGK